jgi:Lon protease-like protein
VHEEWTHGGNIGSDPDFGEAASDYAQDEAPALITLARQFAEQAARVSAGMTRAHLADIAEALEEAEREAREGSEWVGVFAPNSRSAKKYTARALDAKCRAARLAEVAAMIQAQIGADDADHE